jgi:hypothetical protein
VPTVLPEPLYPTINVNGVWNWIVSLRMLSKERTLQIHKLSKSIENDVELPKD